MKGLVLLCVCLRYNIFCELKYSPILVYLGGVCKILHAYIVNFNLPQRDSNLWNWFIED